MSSILTFRRGSSASHENFRGEEGEVTYNVDTKELVAHDGEVLGGFPVAGRKSQAVNLVDYGAAGNGGDDTPAFAKFITAIRQRSLSGGLVTAYIPQAPSGEWQVSGTVLFNISNLVLFIGGNIKQLSTSRCSTLLFAYDAQQQPAQPLTNVMVYASPGTVIDGNGADMPFAMLQGDESDNESSVRFNYIDNLFFKGMHATNGPVDSLSVRRCRNWLGEQIETSFASAYDSFNRLGNGFSATTDWDAANWSETDQQTWGYGTLRNFTSHDNPGGTGGTAFNCTGVWFENGNSWDCYTAFSYEKQYQVIASKRRFGGFRNCHGRNATDGFYIDDKGVTVDDLCSVGCVTARAGDTNHLHGNGVTIASCSEFYIGAGISGIANAGVALFNGSGVEMAGSVSAKIATVGTHGIYDRGTSFLRITVGCSIKGAAGHGIYGHNSGGTDYNEGGTSTLLIDNPWIESCGENAVYVDYKGVLDITGIRGRNNCTSKATGAGVGVGLDQLGYARVREIQLRDSSGKQGYLINATSTVAVLNEANNIGDATVAPVVSLAPASVPNVGRVYSPGTAEALRAQNTAASINARARIGLAVSTNATFVGAYLDALRTDSPAANAHKLIAGVFNGTGPVDLMNFGSTGTYFGNGTTDAKNTVDIGGSLGLGIEKITSAGAVNVATVATTQVDPTAGNFTLTLQSAAASSRHVHNFVFLGASANTVTINLGAGTFSDGTTTKSLTSASRTLRVHADAGNNVWALV